MTRLGVGNDPKGYLPNQIWGQEPTDHLESEFDNVVLDGTRLPTQVSSFAYVANSESDNVSVIGTATNSVSATVPVGDGPVGVTITPDGALAYVANTNSHNVSVIDAASNTVTATIIVGRNPSDVAITPDGAFVYVTNTISGNVSVIDTASNTVAATVAVGDRPHSVAITPDGAFAYVTNSSSGNLSVIDTSTNTITTTVTVGIGPNGIAITPNGTFAYIANLYSDNVSVVDIAANTVIATVRVGDGPFGIAITPDGAAAFVTNWYHHSVSVIDTTSYAVTATVATELTPFNVAFTPDGALAYITNFDSNNVSVIDIATNTVARTVPVGSGPKGVATTPIDLPLPIPDLALLFPIGGGTTAYNHDVRSVFDRAGEPNKEDGVIATFDGTVAFCEDGAFFEKNGKKNVQVGCDQLTGSVQAGIYNYRVCADTNRTFDINGRPDVACLDPINGPLLDSIRYRETTDKTPERWPYISYDGHSGYDYLALKDAKDKPIKTNIIAPANGRLCIPTDITTQPETFGLWRTTAQDADGNDLCPYSTDVINSVNDDAWQKFHTFYVYHENGQSTWFLHAGSGEKELKKAEKEIAKCEKNANKQKDKKKKKKAKGKCDIDAIYAKLNKNIEPALHGAVDILIYSQGYADVEEGQHIGFVGDWGTKARHLHFEVREPEGDGLKLVDPYNPKLWKE
jgi:YVTN family beta-propeller protein